MTKPNSAPKAAAAAKLHLPDPSPLKASPHYNLRRLAAFFFISGTLAFLLLIAQQVLNVVGVFGNLIMICFLAWLLAFVVSPLVDGTAHRLHTGRSNAILLVYLGTTLIIVGLVAVALSIGVNEAVSLINRSDEATATITASLNSLQRQLGVSLQTIDLAALFRQAEAQIVPTLKTMVDTQSGNIASTLLSILATLSIILVLSVLLSRTPRVYRLNGAARYPIVLRRS
jgi:predicted PurR-regulated permease PerM